MPSEEGISDAIEMLRAAGCAMTRGQSTSEVGVTWMVTMPEVGDAQLMAACLAHLRSPECKWWPKPGQLLSYLGAGSEDDPAGEDWGRLRRLRREHGGQEPASPDAPRLFLLADSKLEHQARWQGLVECGGWLKFCERPDRLQFETGYLYALQCAESKLAHPHCSWSEPFRREVRAWMGVASASDAYVACCALAGASDASMEPRDPRQPEPYRLHQDRQRERAMWAGMMAAGGWREIWPDGVAIPADLRPSDAANRRQFVSTHRTVMSRIGRMVETSKVAALVDLTAEQMMLSDNVIGMEGRRIASDSE